MPKRGDGHIDYPPPEFSKDPIFIPMVPCLYNGPCIPLGVSKGLPIAVPSPSLTTGIYSALPPWWQQYSTLCYRW